MRRVMDQRTERFCGSEVVLPEDGGRGGGCHGYTLHGVDASVMIPTTWAERPYEASLFPVIGSGPQSYQKLGRLEDKSSLSVDFLCVHGRAFMVFLFLQKVS